MERPDFPSFIDNTSRESFRTCPKKWYWQVIRKQVPQTPSIHLHAGGSLAKGLEIARRRFYIDGADPISAIAAGSQALADFYGDFDLENGFEDHNKSKARMLNAFEDYFMEYPLGSDPIKPMRTADGGAGIEFSFAIPLEIRHPQTGDPLLYAGRFDMLGEMNDTLYVVDEKTTGSLGPSWASQWDLNSQFTGYCMAARHYGYPVASAIIRGIGLLKSGVKHQQVILNRPDWQIQRWWDQLHRDIRMMIAQWEQDTGDGQMYDLALGSACTSYGGCSYKKLCLSNDPEAWVPAYYRAHEWNPLAVGEGD